MTNALIMKTCPQVVFLKKFVPALLKQDYPVATKALSSWVVSVLSNAKLNKDNVKDILSFEEAGGLGA